MCRALKIDAGLDATYISLPGGWRIGVPVVTRELAPGVNLDYQDDSLIGIEIFDYDVVEYCEEEEE